MLLMKIVVVVNGESIYFKGQKISAYYDMQEERHCLIVNDLTYSPPKKMGAFAKWDYWRYVEE